MLVEIMVGGVAVLLFAGIALGILAYTKLLHTVMILTEEVNKLDYDITEWAEPEEPPENMGDLASSDIMKGDDENPFLDPDTGLFSYQYYKKNKTEGKE